MPTFRTLLLAAAFTAGMPALAMAQDRPDDQQHRGDHGNRGGDNGGQRGERGAPAAQPAPAPQAQPSHQASPPQQQQVPQAAPQNQRTQDFRGNRGAPQADPNANRGDRRDGRGGQQGNRGDQRPDQYRDNRGGQFAPGGQGGYRADQRPDQYRGGQFNQGRPGNRPDFRDGRGQGFAHDWRNDRRFDWRGYRDQHREIFRGQRYIAPQGWGYGYRRFDVGISIPPFFFGQQYWISDPWAYRLPPADGPYRWIRYYNDVLLVDLRSGVVVDSIPGFFW